MRKYLFFLITLLIGLGAGAGIYYVIVRNSRPSGSESSGNFFKTNLMERESAGTPDFVAAAKLVTREVVHIKSTYGTISEGGNPLEDIFGPSLGENVPAMASGSGVIISPDGYIATNNHVVENAVKLEVILPDRRVFLAKLVGRDPNTDLALLKINATGLPAIKIGNSDAVNVGEWVLAVGYPYSLNTTVTAGIISAKGRNIGIINNSAETEAPQGNTAVESFIQTDAAINPGNSGGALVNVNGELIGINTAIASLTGSYAGYAFAIPVNLANKILGDLKKYGEVKRGILGVAFPSPATEDQYLRQQGIKPGSVNGVYITNIQNGSAAAAGGLKEGDIIQSIDGVPLFSSSEFSERIARHGPGDKIKLTYLRKGKLYSTAVTLKSEDKSKPATDHELALKEIYKKLGASFAPLTPAIKEQFNLRSGVLVTEVYRGGFFELIGIAPGTIIAYINGKAVSKPADIEQAFIDARNGRVQILAIAPDGSKVAFNFSFGA